MYTSIDNFLQWKNGSVIILIQRNIKVWIGINMNTFYTCTYNIYILYNLSIDIIFLLKGVCGIDLFINVVTMAQWFFKKEHQKRFFINKHRCSCGTNIRCCIIHLLILHIIIFTVVVWYKTLGVTKIKTLEYLGWLYAFLIFGSQVIISFLQVRQVQVVLITENMPWPNFGPSLKWQFLKTVLLL